MTTEHLQVYFSASSEIFEKDDLLYEKIISDIEAAGGMVISNWTKDKEKLSADEVFEQATKAILTSDLLVAEISYPSTGVGQQIALALNNKIPVLAIYRKGKKISSRFTLGTKSPLLHLMIYEPDKLLVKLTNGFKRVLQNKFVKFNFISTREINMYLDRKSRRLKTSKSDFLRQIIEENMKN